MVILAPSTCKAIIPLLSTPHTGCAMRVMRARLALLPLAVLVLALQSDAQPAKIRGAALGGWLLLERFIATTVMGDDPRIVDEWTFGLYANETQRLMLQDHWANFYQETDFQRMRDVGLTHVRIAIGYWHLCTQTELDAYLEVGTYLVYAPAFTLTPPSAVHHRRLGDGPRANHRPHEAPGHARHSGSARGARLAEWFR